MRDASRPTERLFWSTAVAEVRRGRQLFELVGLAGGNYAQVWRLVLGGTGEQLVGRRLPGRSATSFEGVHEILQRCRRAGAPVPEPVWRRGEPGRGHQAQILSWIDGSHDPPGLDARVPAIVDLLLRLRGVDVNDVALEQFPVLPSAAWQRRIAASPNGRQALQLLHAQPAPPAGSGLVHGDLCLANLLWNDTAVAGLIDWDRVSIGSPAIDLAAVWVELLLDEGPAAASQLLAGYRERARLPPDLDYWQLRLLASAIPQANPDQVDRIRTALNEWEEGSGGIELR